MDLVTANTAGRQTPLIARLKDRSFWRRLISNVCVDSILFGAYSVIHLIFFANSTWQRIGWWAAAGTCAARVLAEVAFLAFERWNRRRVDRSREELRASLLASGRTPEQAEERIRAVDTSLNEMIKRIHECIPN